jgi:hypothetical protein
MLLGKARIQKADEEYQMDKDKGKRLMIAADLNDLVYNELILSIDDSTLTKRWHLT